MISNESLEKLENHRLCVVLAVAAIGTALTFGTVWLITPTPPPPPPKPKDTAQPKASATPATTHPVVGTRPDAPTASSTVQPADTAQPNASSTPATDESKSAMQKFLVWLRAFFFERSWIQYATTFFFWATIARLVLKHLRGHYERKAFAQGRIVLESSGTQHTLDWTAADRIRDCFADSEHHEYRDSMTFSRIIHGLNRLRRTQSTSELDDYFRSRGEISVAELETSYTGTRYVIWLIPTLGFIGTVMGIGLALGGFGGILESAQDFAQIRAKLPGITTDLATAFDTTLLALGLSAVAVLYMSYVLRNDENLLEGIDSLCLDDVCAMFEEHNRGSEEIVKAMAKGVDDIRDALNGNRAEIVTAMFGLPQLIGQDISDRLDKTVAESMKGVVAALKEAGDRQADATGQLLEHVEEMQDAHAGIGRNVESIQKTVQDLVTSLQDSVEATNELLGRMRDLLAGAAGAAEGLRGLTEAVTGIKAIADLGKSLKKNTDLLARLCEGMDHLTAPPEASKGTGTPSGTEAASDMQAALGDLAAGVAELRTTIADQAPHLESILKESAGTQRASNKTLANLAEGIAAVLVELTKLINRLNDSQSGGTGP